MNRTTTAITLGLLACLLWSGNFIIARLVNQSVEPVTLSFMRWVTALVFILPFTWRGVIAAWPIIRANLRYLVFMGVISVGTFNTLVYVAAHYTTTNHIALICATSPVWTILFAALVGSEKLTKGAVGGTILALAGALLVISEGAPQNIFNQPWNGGDLLLLVAAVLWAVYSVLLKWKPQGLSLSVFLTVIIIIGILWLLPFYIYKKSIGVPTPFDLPSLGIYLYVGLAASLVSWFAWNSAVSMIGAVKTGLIGYSMPVFSAILAIVILAEPVELYHVAGFICVISGILISNRKKLRK